MFEGKSNKEEMIEMMKAYADANRDATQEMIKSLVTQLLHPPQSEEEKQAELKIWESRCAFAKIDADAKKRKRAECDPGRCEPGKPHRRPNNIVEGLHAGKSVIAWRPISYSGRNANGQRTEDGPYRIGVCLWCQAEFKPGDPDYEEAISWGDQTGGQTASASMNVRTGNWVNA